MTGMLDDTAWRVADMLARAIDDFERGSRVDFEAVLKVYRAERSRAEDEEDSR